MRRTILLLLLCAPALPVLAQQPATTPPPAQAAPAAEPLRTIDQQALLDRIAARDETLLILDVRTAEEYAQGHVEGAVHIPYDQLPQRVGEIEAAKDRDVVLYCRSGRRSEIAAGTLREKGFTRLLHLEGDMLAWEAAGRPTAKD
jgi:phage shock protein E